MKRSEDGDDWDWEREGNLNIDQWIDLQLWGSAASYLDICQSLGRGLLAQVYFPMISCVVPILTAEQEL